MCHEYQGVDAGAGPRSSSGFGTGGASPPDDALGEAAADDLHVRGHLPQHGEGQPVHVRPQAADVLRERLWEHVDAPLHQVGGGGPAIRQRLKGGCLHSVRSVRTVQAVPQVQCGEQYPIPSVKRRARQTFPGARRGKGTITTSTNIRYVQSCRVGSPSQRPPEHPRVRKEKGVSCIASYRALRQANPPKPQLTGTLDSIPKDPCPSPSDRTWRLLRCP